MAHHLALLLGFAPELAVAEITAVTGISPELPAAKVAVLPEYAGNPAALQARLGGTIKTVSLLQELTDDSQESIEQAIVANFTQGATTKNIALGEWGRDHLPTLNIVGIKRALQEAGYKVRFREGNRYGLNGAVLAHHAITEFIVLFWREQWWLGQTAAVSNPDAWAARDREKPFADHKRGMLAPKVARMLVNLAIGEARDGVVFDPFCGTGTVLLEARAMGYPVIGADADQKAIEGTRQNLEWQSQEDPTTVATTFELMTVDAASVRPANPENIRFVVTEPFLGRPKPMAEQLPNIIKGLEKLYWGAFKNWSRWLHDGTKIVIIFPKFQTKNPTTDFAGLLDKIKQIGYSTQSGTWEYAHEDAVVARQILTFTFNKEN